MKKEQAIKIIEEAKEIYLNKDQKIFAKGIINSLNEKDDIQGYLDFIMKRTGLGFKFDVAPDIAEGRIAVVNEMKEKRINVSDIVEEDENKLIIGENYEALKNLLLTHEEKIDIIYIDPPYNTEKAREDGNNSSKEGKSSKFIYKDKFGRNGWLNMMRERLHLAKRLLSPEGVIFVSIDESEQAYLKVLMDDVFGEDNFVSNIYWRSRTSQNYSDKHISDVGEYILVFAKNKQILPAFNKNLSLESTSYSNPDNDPRGKWTSSGLIRNDGRPIYKVISPIGVEHTQAFLYTKENFEILDKQGRIWWGKNGDAIPRKKSYLNEWNGNPYISAIINSSISNDLAKKLLKSIIEPSLAEKHTPKPVELIKIFVNLIANKNLTILDFFAGSGTTGHAVMELNREDGGNRKFILVTNNENNIAFDITYERMYRIIFGKSTDARSNFEWIKSNKPFVNSMLRVFNIKHYNIDVSQINKINEITREAITNLQMISNKYNPKEINAYYDLDGLNPYNELQLNQEYSTDPIEEEDESN